MPIPRHQPAGVLPGFYGRPSEPSARSPYKVSPEEIAGRFGHSAHRRALLEGWLKYRAELRALGFSGFQWIDGSFVEELGAREPKDVDVITWYQLPAAVDLKALVVQRPELFTPRFSKPQFKCDVYFAGLDLPPVKLDPCFKSNDRFSGKDGNS